jgi:putative acetyltransferase
MPIAIERADQPDVMRLIEELDAYQKPLYPPESHHGVDIAALCRSNVVFAVARSSDGQAVGCGAVVLGEEYGELKRMYVVPGHRGLGIAKALLAFLESQASAAGVKTLKLETGYKQSEAIDLYSQSGYIRCAPFGDYTEDPNSVFMSKDSASRRAP